MKVEELVIDGFKSYSTRTVITDWDPQFNAITGLNGSGKSNILDAICFVLGLTNTSSLRANNLQDLIHKQGQAGITKASVTITFDNSDLNNQPVAYKTPKISITRKISIDAPNTITSKYLINGRKATQKEVTSLLQSVQLNINNPNFLIMQGKITKMLNMKPLQVLGLIEEAAGTKSYEIQREASEKIMEKKNAKLESIKSIREIQVKPKLAELAKQTEVVIEFKNKLNEKDHMLQILSAYEYEESKDSLATHEKLLADAKIELTEHQKSEKELESQIVRIVSEINQLKEKNSNVDSAVLKDLENQEQTLLKNLTRLTTSKNHKLENVAELTDSIKRKETEIANIEKEIENKREKFNSIQTEFLREEEELVNFKNTLQKKEDLLSTLSTGISSKGSDSGFQAQLREANRNLTETNTKIEQEKIKIRHLQSQVDDQQFKLHTKELASCEKDIEQRQQKCTKIRESLKKSGFDQAEYDSLRNEEKQLLQDLNTKSRMLQEFTRQDSRFEFAYENPHPNFNPSSVKGFCGELFNLSEENHNKETALEVCAGYKLFNVVVDNEKTGESLLNKGRLRKRTTFVPLNKIRSNVVNPNVVDTAKRLAPNEVELALNLVTFDNEVKGAVEYVFGNKLVCNDPDTAKKVTFNESIKVGSITLEGDTYDPSGRLSGGSRRTSSSLIKQFNRFKQLKGEVERIKRRLNQISEVLRRMNAAAEQNHDIQQNLVREEYQISQLQKKMSEGPSAVYIQNYKTAKIQIDELNNLIQTYERKVQNLKDEIASINNDIREFNSDGSTKLRQLKEEITNMTSEVQKKENVFKKRKALFNQEKIKNDDQLGDIDRLKNDILQIKDDIPNIQQSIEEDTIAINQTQQTLEEVSEKIANEKEETAGQLEELNQLTSHLERTRNQLSSIKKSNEKLADNITHYKKVIAHDISTMKEAKGHYDWIDNETRRLQVIANNPDPDLELCVSKIAECDARLAELRSKGADANIIQQADMLRNHDAMLESKIRKIEKDKLKIQETTNKLDSYLKLELEKTYQHVSNEFGEIFNLLLPGSSAKLVKVDDNDITKGLEVKVQLGSVWKESLVELSGGQRSLIALALIMSLLQYKPAPMYILDEVDAALDLSHTQSIGQLIKTKFKGSQFIVVSLKEGMFTNANRLFKVRFQDGRSVVSAH